MLGGVKMYVIVNIDFLACQKFWAIDNLILKYVIYIASILTTTIEIRDLGNCKSFDVKLGLILACQKF